MFETKALPISEHSEEALPNLFHSGSRKVETEQSRHQAVKQAIAMMRGHYHTSLTLQTIADSVQLSPFHFNRIFRSITGVPPSVYLAALRIDQAKKMLLRTNYSVTSICFDIGYNSLGTFTTRFSQLVGLTPTQLRRISRDQHVASFFQDWDQLKSTLDVFRNRPEKGTIEGNISLPQSFDGLIFIGLFRDPIPQGDPVSSTVLAEAGYYCLPLVPPGKYYLFATALPATEDFRGMFESGAYLRCSRQPVISMPYENMRMSVNLVLNQKNWTDTPILLALPWLLITKLSDFYHMPLDLSEVLS